MPTKPEFIVVVPPGRGPTLVSGSAPFSVGDHFDGRAPRVYEASYQIGGRTVVGVIYRERELTNAEEHQLAADVAGWIEGDWNK